ncbi:MAG: hypothetical protein PF569_04225 [Candidatus Woesearchaeota archaeon]|jgi:hypothetical protein|nr:hypothetical protein [Candidatus Woesearchaeota archaeon]
MEKRNNLNKKCQAISTDILVVIVVVLFGALFLVATKVNNTSDVDVDALYAEASVYSNAIVDEFKNTEIIDEENNIQVENLLQIDIEQLREELNIRDDFCIVFEKDGNLVKIDSDSNVTGVGSSSIIVNDVPCVSS